MYQIVLSEQSSISSLTETFKHFRRLLPSQIGTNSQPSGSSSFSLLKQRGLHLTYDMNEVHLLDKMLPNTFKRDFYPFTLFHIPCGDN